MTMRLPLRSEIADFKFKGKSCQCSYKSSFLFFFFKDLSQNLVRGGGNFKGEPTAVVAKETSCIVIQVINQ